jgi:hypothetical protein
MKKYIKSQTTGDWIVKLSMLIIPFHLCGVVEWNFTVAVLFAGSLFGFIIKLTEPQKSWIEFITIIVGIVGIIGIALYKTRNIEGMY